MKKVNYLGELEGEPDELRKKAKENILEEIKTLAKLDHENIVGYYGSYMDEDETMHIFQELMSQSVAHAL